MTTAAAMVLGTPLMTARTRSASIDIARGLIVALMALDHVRIFFSAARFDPVDLDATTPGFFVTRWVTHLCAPGFFFLAGLGAALLETKSDRGSTSRFLATRGLLLVLFEIFVFGLAWSFNPGWFWLGVIWGLGASMVLLAGLIWLGRPAALALGLLFTLFHDSLWGPSADPNRVLDVLLYSGGVLDTAVAGRRIVLYPILPWLALMMMGYGVSGWLVVKGRLHVPRALLAGAFALAAFAVLRTIAVGEPPGGSAEDGQPIRSLLSFFNVEKYPPSLQFSAVTLGLLLLFTAAAESVMRGKNPTILRPLQTFGEAPFFFYLVHLFLIHSLALAAASTLGWPTDYLFWSGVGPSLEPPAGYGFWLQGIFLVWIVVLALLLPACAAFAELKRSRRIPWLKYL